MTYQTTGGDTWDLISFRLFNNEYFMDQLIAANLTYVNTEVFDQNVIIQIPQVLVPQNISPVVWGNIVRYS